MTPFTVIEGGARGADRHAHLWAHDCPLRGPLLGVEPNPREDQPVELLTFPADWATCGKKAGPLRNHRMLNKGKPELVLAFVDKPLEQSRGTAHMVKIAREAHLPVYVIERKADT